MLVGTHIKWLRDSELCFLVGQWILLHSRAVNALNSARIIRQGSSHGQLVFLLHSLGFLLGIVLSKKFFPSSITVQAESLKLFIAVKSNDK